MGRLTVPLKTWINNNVDKHLSMIQRRDGNNEKFFSEIQNMSNPHLGRSGSFIANVYPWDDLKSMIQRIFGRLVRQLIEVQYNA